MISVERLKNRKSHFRVNDWILDSGAFSQISRDGCFSMSPTDYLRQIERWKACGSLVAAVAQDWMCEAFILEKTGKRTLPPIAQPWTLCVLRKSRGQPWASPMR